MGRINTNIPAIMAVHDLMNSQADLERTLGRLSSGLRINSAQDDPSGLVISELLRSEMASLDQAVVNSERASNVLATAEGALDEVNTLLVTIKQLVVEAANGGGLTADEIEATQLEIDSAVESIARIASSTSFGGTPLLNGNFDYVLSGGVSSQITRARIHSAQFDGFDYVPMQVEVTQQAEQGMLAYTAPGLPAGSGVALEVTGNLGTEVFRFAGSAAASAIAYAVNTFSDDTGVSAYISGGALFFVSEGYGSEDFVSVNALEGTFALSAPGVGAAIRDHGDDIDGFINGLGIVARGRTMTLNTNYLDAEITVDEAFTGISQFAIVDGGMSFQLGPRLTPNHQFNLAIPSIHPAQLGAEGLGFLADITTGGPYSLTEGHAMRAGEIVEEVTLQVLSVRGRLGAFAKNTVDTNINSLMVALENVSSAQSVIRDADFAVETANLTRAQILVSAGTSVLAVANATPQSILSLLQ